MRHDGPVRVALVLLVAGLVGAGLYFAGGPQTGRIERRDATRLADLMALGAFVVCVANGANGTLPAALMPDAACDPDLRTADPFTAVHYLYIKSSPIAFQLCAEFERPDWLSGSSVSRGIIFESSTGCLQESYR